MAYGPATATLGGVEVSGNAQTKLQSRGAKLEPFPNPLPLTAAICQQLGASFEVSADIGWLDSGAGLRVRLPSRDDLPLVLRAGVRSGAVAPFGRPTYHGALAVEGYPLISGAREGLSARSLVLSLGLAAGAFQHDLLLPAEYDLDSDAPHGSANEIVIRRELRLQAAIGVHVQEQRAGFTVALQPWIVLAHATSFSASCDECDGQPPVTAFSQTWGVSLLVIPAFRLSGR